jgi:hypothetical protein
VGAKSYVPKGVPLGQHDFNMAQGFEIRRGTILKGGNGLLVSKPWATCFEATCSYDWGGRNVVIGFVWPSFGVNTTE